MERIIPYLTSDTKIYQNVIEDINRARQLRQKIGPTPVAQVWKNAARYKDFSTHARAKNQLYEFQHAFWKAITEPID